MIKIDFKENTEYYTHEDSVIVFPTLNRDFLGDTYWFSVGLDNEESYSDVVKSVATLYKKDCENIKNLNVGSSYFWFFHFFDQCNQGVLITNLDNSKFKLNFVVKCTDYFEEFIFEKEEYLLDRSLFIDQLEEELIMF